MEKVPEFGKARSPKENIANIAKAHTRKITVMLEYTFIMDFPSLILTLALISGQLIRIPFGINGGITLLDISVICLNIFGLLKSRFSLKKPPLFLKIFFLFLAVCLISLFFTPLHLGSLEYLSSLSYTIRLGFYALFFWLVISNAFDPLQKKINRILIYCGLGLAILGLLQFIFLPDLGFLSQDGWDPHFFRTVSTFFDPNFAGGFFVLTLLSISHPISYFGGGKTITPKILLLVFTITYLALLTTFSRSSYLMFLVSGLMLSFLKKSKKLLTTTSILFLILLLSFQIYTQLVAKPRNINREESASFRLNTWQQGITLFQKSPIFGVGYNSYRYAIAEYKLADNQFIQSHGASSNDSSILTILATTGIIGFSVYLLFLLTLIKSALKNNLILVAAIVGLLIHSIFANSLFYPFILFWLFLKAADTKS